jgi:hypothetical protein
MASDQPAVDAASFHPHQYQYQYQYQERNDANGIILAFPYPLAVRR